MSLPARLPLGFARRFGVLLQDPLPDGRREVLCKSRLQPATIAELQRVITAPLTLRQVSEAVFDEQLTLSYQQDSDQTMQMIEGLGENLGSWNLATSIQETEDLLDDQDDAPVIRLINSLLAEAVRAGASDVHVETYESRLLVRFRIDGILREAASPGRALAPLLVSRIKVMARLDIAEKRVPQDGRISIRIGGREVDVRVSTIPASNGERVVMRLLDKLAGRRDLRNLGMQEPDLVRMQELIQNPHGVLLVTGPTGSGKSTSLYACIESLNDQTRNILTVEDPIEYEVEGIGQTQVNTRVDMTFAKGLRAILRQDPDVVMVGEIRDHETADIAIQASLTGHLVLSTLHTNSALGAVTRLANMGVASYLLASSLTGLVAQRLVRTLCENCREACEVRELDREILQLPASASPLIYRAAGCEKCAGQGYRGRIGIYEVVPVDDELRELIHKNVSLQELEQYSRGICSSIRDDGRSKVLSGRTTVEEILRVTMEDASS